MLASESERARHQRGQLLVELAVALPLILFVILGGVEAGFLVVAKAAQDRSTAVVADWAAGHPGESWESIANRELPGCEVIVDEPRPDLLTARSRCLYRPVVLVMFQGLPISTEEAAARSKGAEPSPVASPSS